MKVALTQPGVRYDPKSMQSWKLDLEKAFGQLNPLTIIQPTPFTPIVYGSTTAGTPTYGTQFGEWSRIGQRVFFNLYVTLTALGGMAGNVRIDGLALPSRSVTNGYTEHVCRWGNVTLAANYTFVCAQQTAGNKYLDLVTTGTANVSAALLGVTTLAANSNFLVTGSYAVEG